MKLEKDLSETTQLEAQEKGADSMHSLMLALDDTFHKSSHNTFKSFFQKNKKYTKWMIFSDYVFDDKSKEHDVATFSLMPYFEEFDTLSESIKNLSKKDLKNTKKINPDLINFINESPILNLSFIFNKRKKLHTDENAYFTTKFSMLAKQCKTRIENNDNPDYNKKTLKRYKLFLNELKNKNKNLKLFRNIDLISQISAYISFQMYSELNSINLIGWFSDRDSILSYKIAQFKTPLVFDLTHSLFHALVSNFMDEDYKSKLIFGLPENTGNMFYDSYNRIPDLIAGSIADYNIKENKCSEKTLPVIENILTNKEKCIIYKLNTNVEVFEASIIDLELQV